MNPTSLIVAKSAPLGSLDSNKIPKSQIPFKDWQKYDQGLLFLLVLCWSVTTLVTPVSANPSHALVMPIQNLTIDGQFDDWPAHMPWYPIVVEHLPSVEGISARLDPLHRVTDCRGRFTIGYYAATSMIYFAFEIEDESDVIDGDRSGSVSTEGERPRWDGVEIYLDMTHGSLPRARHQFACLGGKPTRTTQKNGVQVARARHSNLTRYEWAINTAGLRPSQTLTSFMMMSFNVVVYDRDEDGSFSLLSWTEGIPKKEDNTWIAHGDLSLRPDLIAVAHLTVQVNIRDHHGIAPAGRGPYERLVTVEIWHLDHHETFGFTDSEGKCQFPLMPATYGIRVWCPGTSDTATVNAIMLQSGDHREIAVMLQDNGSKFSVDQQAGSDGRGTSEAPFKRIRDAIAVSGPGDTISIAAGIYAESIQANWGLYLLGQGADQTLLQDQQAGITLKNPQSGAIRDLAVLDGQGIALHGACRQFDVTRTLISRNHSGGLHIERGHQVRVSQNLITLNHGNVGGGLFLQECDSTVLIHDNVIIANRAFRLKENPDHRIDGIGGGLAIWGGKPRVEQNTIVYNRAEIRWGGITTFAFQEEWARPTITENIIAYNENGGMFLWYHAAPIVRRNQTWKNGREDDFGGAVDRSNVSSDPGFQDPIHGDVRGANKHPLIKGKESRVTNPWLTGPIPASYLPPPDSLQILITLQQDDHPGGAQYHVIDELDGEVEEPSIPPETITVSVLPAITLNHEVKRYTVKDGVISNTIVDLAVAHDGSVWFATDQGLSRFDGIWKNFSIKDGLDEARVQVVYADHRGRVWCGTASGLSLYDGERWQSTLKSRPITSIAEDPSNHLWMTMETEIIRYTGQGWDYFKLPFSNGLIRLIDSKGHLWISRPDGRLLHYDGQRWSYQTGPGLPDEMGMSLSLIEMEDGAIWYANRYQDQHQWRSRVSWFDGNRWHNYVFPNDPRFELDQMTLSKDHQAGLWSYSGKYLFFYDGQRWSRVTNWESTHPITDALITPDGTMWIGTDGGGVIRLQRRQWAGLGRVIGQRTVEFHLDEQGTLWQATDYGLRLFSPQTGERAFHVADGLLAEQILCMTPDKNGGMWIGLPTGVNYFHPDQPWQAWTTKDGLPNGAVQALLVGRDGTVWAGTTDGLACYQNGSWRLLTPSDGLESPHILALCETPDGDIWIGTPHGAYCYRKNRIIPLLEVLYPDLQLNLSTLGDKNVAKMDQWLYDWLLINEVLWWMTLKRDNGVLQQLPGGDRILEAFARWMQMQRESQRFERGQKLWKDLLAQFYQRSCTPRVLEAAALYSVGNRPITSILVDDKRRTWFGTEQGVFCLTGDRWSVYDSNAGLADNLVEKIRQDRRGRLWFLGPGGASRFDGTQWISYTAQDGLPDNHVLAVLEDQDGVMVFGTAGGVLRRLPDTNPPNTEILEGPKELSTDPSVVFRYIGGDVESGSQQLTYSYALLSADERLLDAKWSPYSSDIFVQFNLLDGDYTLIVRARDKEGNVDPSPATRSFTIRTEEAVNIAEISIHPIFPAKYRWYAKNRVGTVALTNKGKTPLKGSLQLYFPEWMDVPTEHDVTLPPAAVTEVAVHANFADRIASLTSPKHTSVHLTFRYPKGQKLHTAERSTMAQIYHRNALTWSDVRTAGAFITPNAPQVRDFARRTIQQHRRWIAKGLDRHITQAMILFNALSAAGLRYINDPNTPYAVVSQTASAVDEIQYPAQLLASKTGDCDDCTVLYCALLENIGIPTALIDAPGHLFMMFNTGVDADGKSLLCLDDNRLVVYDNQVWIPVEVTMLEGSFEKAWQHGAETVADLVQSRNLRVISVAQAWMEYPSVHQDGTRVQIEPNPEALSHLLRDDQAIFTVQREAVLNRHYLTPLQQNPNNHALRDQLARIYIYQYRPEVAIEEYRTLLDAGYQPASTYNNLGIAFVAAQNYQKAMECFKTALELDPTDDGIRENLRRIQLRTQTLQVDEFHQPSSQAANAVKGEQSELGIESFRWSNPRK